MGNPLPTLAAMATSISLAAGYPCYMSEHKEEQSHWSKTERNSWATEFSGIQGIQRVGGQLLGRRTAECIQGHLFGLSDLRHPF